MTYKQAQEFITKASKAGIVLGLESIKELLNELGNPQDDLKFVHIAGTNGKGSTLAFLSTILETAGYKTGRYISPTVKKYLERIQINRKNISENDFVSGIQKIKDAINNMLGKGLNHPSVFEIETALGFLYFKEQKCDIVIMETGMGGVTDATNIIKNTLVSIFTSVSRDHMDFLGDTIEDLTNAKVGIIKKNTHVVFGNLPNESISIIKEKSKIFDNPIHQINKNDIIIQNPHDKYTQVFDFQHVKEIKLNMIGKHQIENASLAIMASWVLREHGFAISDGQIKDGLRNTEWFARMTVVKKENPIIIIDGAHNEDSVRVLAKTLKELFPKEKISGIMGVFKDKEVEVMLHEIKSVLSDLHTISLPEKKRTLTAEALAELAVTIGIKAKSHETTESALNAALKNTDVLVAFGSFSYLNEIAELTKGSSIKNKKA